jgi:hypothetical protein
MTSFADQSRRYIYIHPRTSDCPNRDRVAVSLFFRLVNLSYPYHQTLERFLEQSDPADRAPSLSTECLRGNSNSGSTVMIHAGFTVLPQSSASSASSLVGSSFSPFKLPCRRWATSTESRRFITGIRQCGQLRLALPTQLNVPPVNVNGQGRGEWFAERRCANSVVNRVARGTSGVLRIGT